MLAWSRNSGDVAYEISWTWRRRVDSAYQLEFLHALLTSVCMFASAEISSCLGPILQIQMMKYALSKARGTSVWASCLPAATRSEYVVSSCNAPARPSHSACMRETND
eukprot:358752-Chlamydomonas_euryale.AAC.17